MMALSKPNSMTLIFRTSTEIMDTRVKWRMNGSFRNHDRTADNTMLGNDFRGATYRELFFLALF